MFMRLPCTLQGIDLFTPCTVNTHHTCSFSKACYKQILVHKDHISSILNVMLEEPESCIPLPILRCSFVDQWPFVTLFPVSENTSLIWPGWLHYYFVLQQRQFFIWEERTYLISEEYKLMSRWSLFISVAFRIPWVCSVQMRAYTGLCKHTLIHAPVCFCGCDNTVDLPYPLFSSFHSSSRARAQLLWFWNSLPGAHLSKLFCSELHLLGVGSKHLKERQPKFWGFSF